jgi:23S rRNA pseudouridine2604 synthase
MTRSPRSGKSIDMSEELVRLSKLMADLGICSRREADLCIEKGWVKVNGLVVDQLGSKVSRQDEITLKEEAYQWIKEKLTVIINKPVGYVSGQAEENYTPASHLLNAQNQVRNPGDGGAPSRLQLMSLAPAGRLDIDSWGLLILTQDGRVARSVISPTSKMKKEYLVWVDGPINDSVLRKLRHGLSLDGKALLPAEVEHLKNNQLKFVLQEGKKRQIRRMCEMVGLQVTGLLRTRIGPIQLGQLKPQQWRYLSRKEVFALLKNEEEKSNAFKKRSPAGVRKAYKR